jgi:hypothetical protein
MHASAKNPARSPMARKAPTDAAGGTAVFGLIGDGFKAEIITQRLTEIP